MSAQREGLSGVHEQQVVLYVIWLICPAEHTQCSLYEDDRSYAKCMCCQHVMILNLVYAPAGFG